MNNRKLVVILMIIVAILIIALVGAIIYIVAKENKNSKARFNEFVDYQQWKFIMKLNDLNEYQTILKT